MRTILGHRAPPLAPRAPDPLSPANNEPGPPPERTTQGRACAKCNWHEAAWHPTFAGMHRAQEAAHDPSGSFPAAFVWTKMQAEAGQALTDIVLRKELERVLGGGQFWWGIGNPLGENLTRLIARDPAPPILFSVMRGRPKREDAAPDAVVAWTAHIDASGRMVPLPAHVLVTSRATTAAGEKRRHYALVCRADRPLTLATLGELDATHYRNLGSEAPRVGASQVTAVVEHVASRALPASTPDEAPLAPAFGRSAEAQESADDEVSSPGPTQRYEVNLRAVLDVPYFVRLARPVALASADRAALERAATAADPHAWAAFVRGVRAQSEERVSQPESDDLFSWYA